MYSKIRLTGFITTIIWITLMLAACASVDDSPKDDESSNNSAQDTEDEVKKITIGMDPYEYVKLPTYLGKELLEEQGYEVEIQVADLGILYAGLADRRVDVFPDVWEPNLHSNYIEKYKDDIELIGPLYEESPLGIAVPEYMEDVNSIEDLKKYSDQFESEIYGIEAGTGMNLGTPIMFEAYDMDYELIESSTGGMLAQVKGAIAAKEPIAFVAWRPHTMFDDFDIKLLEDPKSVWNFDTVHVGVVKELKEKSPTAYTLFSNMHFANEEVEEWMIQLRDTGKEAEELAKEWISNNPDRVEKWLNP